MAMSMKWQKDTYAWLTSFSWYQRLPRKSVNIVIERQEMKTQASLKTQHDALGQDRSVLTVLAFPGLAFITLKMLLQFYGTTFLTNQGMFNIHYIYHEKKGHLRRIF